LKLTSKLSNNGWDQINEEGFGDTSNVGTKSITVYRINNK